MEGKGLPMVWWKLIHHGYSILYCFLFGVFVWWWTFWGFWKYCEMEWSIYF